MHSSASYIFRKQKQLLSFFRFLCFLIIKKNVGRETLLIPDHYHYYVISLDTARGENPSKKMKNENDDKVCNEKFMRNCICKSRKVFGRKKLCYCHVENFNWLMLWWQNLEALRISTNLEVRLPSVRESVRSCVLLEKYAAFETSQKQS